VDLFFAKHKLAHFAVRDYVMWRITAKPAENRVASHA
jgi:hypothetical protein